MPIQRAMANIQLFEDLQTKGSTAERLTALRAAAEDLTQVSMQLDKKDRSAIDGVVKDMRGIETQYASNPSDVASTIGSKVDSWLSTLKDLQQQGVL